MIMDTHIRNVNLSTDLAALAAITSWADRAATTPEDMRRWLEHMPPGRIVCRLVSVDDQNVVNGYALAVHEVYSPEGYFYVWAGVNEDARGQGYGKALRDALWSFLKQHQATRLVTDAWDDDPRSLAFAEHNGFSIDRHLFKSSLDLTTFDEAPFVGVIDKLVGEGIRFTSLAEEGDDESHRRKYHELDEKVSQDIPGYDFHSMDFTEYCLRCFHADIYRPGGRLVAADGDQWIGFATVNTVAANGNAHNEMTGVRREYRGRGIALALKLLAIRFARSIGAQEITTSNDSLNAPMLAVNRKLGYQPQNGQYKLNCVQPVLGE
jgi:GNAT superfamily N-acetyltransferase